ncbi:MAG: hypothetical protein ACJ8GN_17955 [Longimicrobiaceae bacterium]
MALTKQVTFTVNIGGGTYSPTPTNDQASVQVLNGAPAWTVTPYGNGMVISINGQYLSTSTVFLPYKNNCLTTTPDINYAAIMMPYWSGPNVGYLSLVGTNLVLTLDTRGYVTNFEPLQPGNGYPYFQYLTQQSVATEEAAPEGANYVENPALAGAG